MGDCRSPHSHLCPLCERSPPRRCPCRRRDSKTTSPRKHRLEYVENLEPPCYEPPFRQIRSSQLCELPTSYISNNCQTDGASYDNMKQEDVKGVRLEKAGGKKPHGYDHRLSYDTATYFDKIRDTSNFRALYTKEIEAVRERISTWGGFQQRPHHVDTFDVGNAIICAPVQFGDASKLHSRYAKDIPATRERLEMRRGAFAKKFISISANDVGARPKRFSLRTRTKVELVPAKRKTSTAKVNRAIGRIKEEPESDQSSSDGSDKEDGDEEGVKEEGHGDGDDESEEISELQNGVETKNNAAGGDADTQWPVRESLFPHMPPYIRFSMHDAAAPVKIPAGRKFFKWKLSTITPLVVRKTLTNSGFVLVRKSNQWLGTWGRHMKSPMFKTLKDTQKLNHFPGTYHLGRKDRLWRNFQKHINKFGYKEFGFIPQTFVLPQELRILKQNWSTNDGLTNEAWIIKPPALARGQGIRVINKWSQIPKKTSLVVQRYIANPYLINGNKFDLRLYVLVTSFNPLRIYLYPEGLARFASAKYSDDAKDLRNSYVHLTNYSINKLSSQYTANEDANACQGHKWTLSKLWEYMEKQGIDSEALWGKLRDLVIKTMITGESPINLLCEENMPSKYNCYELFGVDVLLDENLKPWLLEVNISPSLHSASPLDAHVKGPLCQTLFDIAQFHFPPRLGQNVRGTPACHQTRLYSTNLTKKEREKHELFEGYDNRREYLDSILYKLTGDDVRCLIQAEDEFVARGKFERIFPTVKTYRYLEFMETRYYNRLFDAWEAKYGGGREEGVEVLRGLCAEKVHLKVAARSAVAKSSLNTTLGALNLQPSKEGQSQQPAEAKQELATSTNTLSSN